ncbi:hypothetical protein [Paenibacillus prosopidis]|uniref:LPXTG-motif cell wall-anchored protein n=1 Tax=Paenibacillus prosopidis TaxID=630520 RepID=A0A368W2L6_9BACL|nr:hypothetical protein [Paenibacillus prosopidis]RCW49046.1 hypothetical protein DFP97_105231 [Paenibacillus prosopidis]
MKRWLLCVLLLVTVALHIAPSQAQAYSYGDANTEDIAETFKLVESSLAGASPNWKAAEEAYKVRRPEIVSHFGEAVGATLDNNFKNKDAKLTVANFKAVLVMNLDRRFTYAIKGFDDYAQTKLLLAKAKATFDTLKPYVSSRTDEINAAFDAALEALGNPGLFGVGQKAAEPDVFKEKVNFIYGIVKPLFPYKAYVKPAATQKPAATPKPAATQKPVATEKPAEEQQQPGTTGSAENDAPAATAATDDKTSEADKPSTETDEQQEGVAAEADADAASTPVPVESETVEAAEQTTAEQEQAAPADSNEAEESGKELAAHAPMEQTDKTNPWVSISVIGGVILLAGGAVWLARKKKWF